jgi:hypothetical protein
MAHDIEADYKKDYENEERQCPRCDSYRDGYCSELEGEVASTGHCDFFRSRN